MSQNYPSSLAALGAVTGATGVAISGAGAASSRTAAGIYTLTLDQGCDASECCVQVTGRGAAPAAGRSWTVTHTSDTVKTVLCTNEAGVAADQDFDYVVHKLPLS